MKKILALIISVLSVISISVCFSSCDKTGTGTESETASESVPKVKLCMTITDKEGQALANTQIYVSKSGEEVTYKTDFLGYVEIPEIETDETVIIMTKNENGEETAGGDIVIKYGDAYKFDDKESEKEKLTVFDGVSVVTAKFSITQDGYFNCTELF